MSRVEQFEGIRRDARDGGLSIRALADKHKVHRRTVRLALADASPPPRKAPVRLAPVLGPHVATVRAWLVADSGVHRKQRHTSRRVWQRLVEEEGVSRACGPWSDSCAGRSSISRWRSRSPRPTCPPRSPFPAQSGCTRPFRPCSVLLTELTPAMVSGWYRRLVPDRPTLRARTYALLRGVLTTAIEDELIAVNPCRVRGASNARPATETFVASPAQVNELAAAMPAPLAAAVQIGAWCQLRNGEVLELRRKDVTAELVSVRRGVTWTKSGAHVGPPKTDAGVRTVSIPPHVRPVLAAHLESFVPDDSERLLFPAAPGPTVHMRQTTFAYHFKRAVLQTTLPATFRFHWLRHTGLTLAAQAGATLAELSARAGHSTTSTVMRYQHATAARDDALAHALSRLASEPDE